MKPDPSEYTQDDLSCDSAQDDGARRYAQNDGADELFMIGMEGEYERAVGPFAEGECRVQLQRIGVTPAAADARIARARCTPRIG